jgi:L-glyceraldehyde 3-phosphate reductase
MDRTSTFVAADDRYATMRYRRSGRSGVQLPMVSLGFWQNFGGDRPIEVQRAIMRGAFDLGITHFDLANNYGPPYGAAEENVGRLLAEDFGSYRDELIISTKAGWDMWPGPYGDLGSRKHLLASLDQSLQRLGLNYVDIFYAHRPDPDTPIEETMGALHTAVQQGKALYVGISSYGPERTRQAAQILRELGTPMLIHQPSYSMFNRWVENGLLDVLEEVGAGAIGFTALAQGLLTGKYLDGIPADSRAARAGATLSRHMLDDTRLAALRELNRIAGDRGQTMAQLAVSWVLRDARMTSVVVGASSVKQLTDTVAAVDNTEFSAAELAAIDAVAVDDPRVDLWRSQSEIGPETRSANGA